MARIESGQYEKQDAQKEGAEQQNADAELPDRGGILGGAGAGKLLAQLLFDFQTHTRRRVIPMESRMAHRCERLNFYSSAVGRAGVGRWLEDVRSRNDLGSSDCG